MLYTTQLNLLLACVDGDITTMRDAAEQKMHDWLRANCGISGVDWKMGVKWDKFPQAHGIEVKIYDPNVALMFRLAFIDHLYFPQDVDLTAK